MEYQVKENLIVIMADQLRWDVLGKGYTPNIDSLMDESTVFDNAYCASPLCVPSRGAFFTGLCPNTNGSLINPWEKKDAQHGDVKKEYENLYQMMEQDWYSIHSGKQHLFTEGGKLENTDGNVVWASTEHTYKQMLKSENVRQPGTLPKFKTLVPEMVGGKNTKIAKYSNAETGCYPYDEKYFFDKYFTTCALDAIEKRDKTKPLFLSAMYLAPHPPLEIPEPWYSRVKDDFELPENVGKFYEYQSPLQMYNLTGIVGSHYTLDQWKEAWRVYLGLVSMLDDCVGQIIALLKEEGIYDNSMIIFTSDHGDMLGSHKLFQKMCMYQESAKIPLSIKMPKRAGFKAQHIDEYVSHLDVMPTISEYFEVEGKNAYEGTSLIKMMRDGNDDSHSEYVFIQYDGNGARSNFQRCILYKRHKLIVDLFKDEMFLELYNLDSDPIESNNLAFDESSSELIEKMYRVLDKHMKDTHDLISLPELNLDEFRTSYCDFKVKQ